MTPSEHSMAKLNAKISESIFGVFYVMTEDTGKSPGGHWKFRFTIALLLIDWLQVLRSLAVSKYLWTSYSISIMRSVDLISLFFYAVQNVVPEWIFYSFSILLAIGAILNATYVMKLFRAGHVKIIWPLKILRFMVASIVTIFFTTVLEFLIYPFRCIDADEENLSAILHGGGAPCDPWQLPEMGITIPTIFVAVAFISFSLLTTFLDFAINPLCRHPLAMCTGRLESLWTLFKVAALLLVYVAPFISATACSIVLFLLSVVIFYYHCFVLPFHSLEVNMVRGGIYLCMSSIIIQHYPGRQDLQHWLLAAVPVAFVAGVFIVHQIAATVNRYLGVLRGQWDEKMRAETHGRNRRASLLSEATQAGGLNTERSTHEQFFDVKWEVQRRFSSGTGAYLAARILLQQRCQNDMVFLMSLLNQDLNMFHLLVLRYVFKERSQAIAQEKLSKMQSATVALDRNYVLFAVNKKTVQEGASESLGKGSISAVNLMEFDQRMDVARKSHRECVVCIKSFWKNVAKRHRRAKAHDAPDRAKKMTDDLEKFTKAMNQARQEYAWLYEKYPSSSALLHSYANFCDHVLNDTKKADQLRQQVAVMESYGKIDGLNDVECEDKGDADDLFGNDAGIGGGMGGGFDNKSVSTDSEPYRVQMFRYMQSWAHLIMSRDSDMLRVLNWRVQCAILFLVVLSLTSFIVTDFVLFNDVALKTIQDIDETGKFRELAATAPYLLRSQMIAAHNHDHDLHDAIGANLIQLTKKMLEDHYHTFEAITTSEIAHFYEDANLEVNIPRPFGWEMEKQSFRQLGADFARRVASAASATYAEHDDPNFELENISQEKRDIAYVFENTLRYLLPAFDAAVAIYEHQMDNFGKLTTILTAVAASLTSFVILVIAINVLRARADLLKRVHANRVSICLALGVPHCVAVRFYKYFSDVELDMAILEDEEQDVRTRLESSQMEITRIPSNASMSSAGGKRGKAQSAKPHSAEFHPPCDAVDASDPQTLTRRLRSPLLAAVRAPTGSSGSEEQAQAQEWPLTADNLRVLMETTSSAAAAGMNDHPGSPLQPPPSHDAKPGKKRPTRMASPPPQPAGDDDDDDDDRDDSSSSGFQGRGAAGNAAGENEEEGGCGSESSEKEAGSEAEEGEASMASLSNVRAAGLVFVERGEGAKTLKPEGGGGGGGGESAGESAEAWSRMARGALAGGEELAGEEGEATSDREVSSAPPRALATPEGEAAKRRAEAAAAAKEIESEIEPAREAGGKAEGAGGEAGEEAAESTPPSLPRRPAPIIQVASSENSESPLQRKKSLRFSSSAKFGASREAKEAEKSAKLDGLLSFVGGGKEASKEKKAGGQEEDSDEEEKSREKENPLALQEVPEEMEAALAQLQLKSQPWYNRLHVYVATLLMLLVLCVLFSLYPARSIPLIINMAPTVDHATERMSLARSCVFLARELEMHDGLSRMSEGEMSGTLDALIHELEVVDRAVRLGSKEHGIISGADHRSKKHNEVMYKLGCPWREDPSDCSLPNNTYPRAAENGLFNLQSQFYDSLKTVLRKYGTSKDEFVNVYNVHREEGEDVSEYEHVHQHEESYHVLLHDPDFLFLDMYDGDLDHGYELLVELFENETRDLLNQVHIETRLLFGIYLGFMLLVFYCSLFLKTLKAARQEVFKAQEFAHTVPLHVLEAEEAATVKEFYMRNNGMETDHHLDDDN